MLENCRYDVSEDTHLSLQELTAPNPDRIIYHK